ncbi:MarR family winged helix-turn-helix transcriptional regulator [Aneurinibacillus sp. REN35]|uniref:MarR family winged helix-turn-helix transcriptional regulator n=1 Tax=Aneurinibacillus sp. REN35 TaxID=3237286 RepID=UPI0035298080
MNTSWEESFGYCTVQTGRNITRFLAAFLKDFDITPEQWTVIKRLADRDGISQKELSCNVDKDQATLTRILDILERKELIQKQMNKEDRRSFLIYLTEKGREIKEELYPLVEEMFEKVLLENISEDELYIFRQVLAQMNANILHADRKSGTGE